MRRFGQCDFGNATYVRTTTRQRRTTSTATSAPPPPPATTGTTRRKRPHRRVVALAPASSHFPRWAIAGFALAGTLILSGLGGFVYTRTRSRWTECLAVGQATIAR